MQFLEKLWKIKPVTTKTKRNYLVSEPKDHTTKFY